MSGESAFRIRTDRDLPILEVTGEVDIGNAKEFETILDQAVGAGLALVVALDDASYFDSKGIHVLLIFAGRLSQSSRHLALVARDGTAPRRLLEIASITTVVPTYGTVEEALAAALQLPPGIPPITSTK